MTPPAFVMLPWRKSCGLGSPALGRVAEMVPALTSVPPDTATVTAEPVQSRWPRRASSALAATVPPFPRLRVSWWGQSAVMSTVMGAPAPLGSPSVRLATVAVCTALCLSHSWMGESPEVTQTLSVAVGTPWGLQLAGFHQSLGIPTEAPPSQLRSHESDPGHP